MSLDLNELKTVIRDSVRTELADQATAALDKAKEDAAKARADGRDILSELRSELTGAKPVSTDERGLEFARAIKAQIIGKGSNRDAKDVAHAWAKEGHRHYAVIADKLAERGMTEGAFASGGALVPAPVMGDFIELTYAKTLALEMGARRLDINRAMDLGKMTSGATVYYVDEAANITPSQPGTGKVALSAKKVAGVVPLSNELLRNPSVGADAMVRDDLVRAMANRRDLSFFRGTGASGQPRGMLYWRDAGNTDTQGGTTVADKVADLIQMIRMVDESNVGLERAGFVMAPRTKWGLASTYDATSGLIFASMLASGTLFGFPVGATTAIPKNLGGGGTESEIHFGAFDDAIMAFDSSTPTQVEVFANGTFHDGSGLISGISSDQSVVRILEAHDVALRHATAWATLTAVTWA